MNSEPWAQEGRNSWRVVYPPEVVTNDPALHALLAMRSKAVPTLEKTLNEPPHESNLSPPSDPIERVKSWTAEIWRQWHGGGAGAPISASSYFGSFQEARMAAAGLAMLALGTDNNAGALHLLEIEAAARSKGYRTPALEAFATAIRVCQSGVRRS